MKAVCDFFAIQVRDFSLLPAIWWTSVTVWLPPPPLISMLSDLCDDRKVDFDDHLPNFMCAYRTVDHRLKSKPSYAGPWNKYHNRFSVPSTKRRDLVNILSGVCKLAPGCYVGKRLACSRASKKSANRQKYCDTWAKKCLFVNVFVLQLYMPNSTGYKLNRT